MEIKLQEFLKSNGIDAYFVGQKKGECKKEYVVVKNDGTHSENGKVGRGFIDLLFFVPISKYTRCGVFKKDVMSLVKDFGKLKYTGNDTSIITDDETKSYTFSVLYENYKKMEG